MQNANPCPEPNDGLTPQERLDAMWEAVNKSFKEPLADLPADTREIPLTRGYVAIVDAADYEWLSRDKWTYADGYAAHYCRIDGKVKSFFMHRLIMHAAKGQEVDHKNGNPLDNRRSNLRLCSHQENQRNQRKRSGRTTSQFKGVQKRGNKWVAQIHLGHFDSESDAARAYDEAALKHYGEFAKLNFPNEVNHVR